MNQRTTSRRQWIEVSDPRLTFALEQLRSLRARAVPGWNGSEKVLTINTAIIAIEALLEDNVDA